MDTDAGKRSWAQASHPGDTMGLILAVVVHSAGIQDRDGAKAVFEKIRTTSRAAVVWADGGYAGKLVGVGSGARRLGPGDCETAHDVKGLQTPAPPLGRRANLSPGWDDFAE